MTALLVAALVVQFGLRRYVPAVYWTAVMLISVVGTLLTDNLTDGLGVSLLVSSVAFAVGLAVVFAAAIAVVMAGYRGRLLGPVVAFWVAYVLTRPLGGSTGDYLSSPGSDGGAGLGTLATSLLFLAAISATVAYLTVTRPDQTELLRDQAAAASR